MNDIKLAKELVQMLSDLLDRMLDINNEAVQALIKSPETRDIGNALGEKAYDVLQYSLHLEGDERFQRLQEASE